jgi:hypothetical protein
MSVHLAAATLTGLERPNPSGVNREAVDPRDPLSTQVSTKPKSDASHWLRHVHRSLAAGRLVIWQTGCEAVGSSDSYHACDTLPQSGRQGPAYGLARRAGRGQYQWATDQRGEKKQTGCPSASTG